MFNVFQLNKKNIRTCLFAIAVCGFISALYFSFQAGCAGDPKTGTLDNPSLALEIESKAFSIIFLGLALGGVAIAFRTSGSAQRFASGLGFIDIGLFYFAYFRYN